MFSFLKWTFPDRTGGVDQKMVTARDGREDEGDFQSRARDLPIGVTLQHNLRGKLILQFPKDHQK